MNLRETVASARQTMTNLADDTEALKHNFFLRGFFKKRGFYNLDQLTPAQYRASKFVTGVSSERIWLGGDELFAARPDGAEELSPEGRRASASCDIGLGRQSAKQPDDDRGIFRARASRRALYTVASTRGRSPALSGD